jgi:hypothetical protein
VTPAAGDSTLAEDGTVADVLDPDVDPTRNPGNVDRGPSSGL